MRLTPSINSTDAARTKIKAFCFSTDAIGDCVYIMGDKVGEHYQVTKVDIDSATFDETVSIGIIETKTTSTECFVHLLTELSGVYSGLTPGSLLYVGLDSKPTETKPSAPTVGTRTVQAIGYAISSTVLYVNPGDPEVLTPSGSGDLSLNDFRRNIVLLGTKNGVNLVFTTPEIFLRSPFTEVVSRNGLIQEEGASNDYVVSEGGGVGTGYNTITLTDPSIAPLAWEKLSIDYLADT